MTTEHIMDYRAELAKGQDIQEGTIYILTDQSKYPMPFPPPRELKPTHGITMNMFPSGMEFKTTVQCEPGDNAGLFANLRAEPRHGMILVSKTKVNHRKGASRMLWRGRKERKPQKRVAICPDVRIETK